MIDFFTALHHHILDPDRFPVASLALVLIAVAGVVTGPMHGNANPFLWAITEKIFGRIGDRLDRRERKASDLLARGLFLTFFGVLFAFLIGVLAANFANTVPVRGASEIVLLALVMSGGTIWYALLKLFFALKDNKVAKGAYYTIARSARIDLSGADNYTITRIGMGLAARSFDKGVIAPVVWYLIAGLPGAYLYAVLSCLAWRFGRDGFTKGFGRVPLALEMLMGMVPSLLAGILIALAGLFTPTGGMTRSFHGMLRKEGRADYAQGGFPLTAMAYALDVSLGGPVVDLDGNPIKRNWVGPEGATAQLGSRHLQRALYIHLMAYLLFIASLAGSLLYR